MTCSSPLACALPPLRRHHRVLVESVVPIMAASRVLAVGLVWTMICCGSCVVRTRRLACRTMRWRNWPSILVNDQREHPSSSSPLKYVSPGLSQLV